MGALFENLRYVVIDELHYYRGVFGSHLANMLRRLARIAEFYGSKPQFICSSATIANPRELAEALAGEPFALVEQNGATRGEKYFVFYNPPVVNRQLGIRRSYLKERGGWPWNSSGAAWKRWCSPTTGWRRSSC